LGGEPRQKGKEKEYEQMGVVHGGKKKEGRICLPGNRMNPEEGERGCVLYRGQRKKTHLGVRKGKNQEKGN